MIIAHDKCRAFEAKITHLEMLLNKIKDWKNELNEWEGDYEVSEEEIRKLEMILERM